MPNPFVPPVFEFTTPEGRTLVAREAFGALLQIGPQLEISLRRSPNILTIIFPSQEHAVTAEKAFRDWYDGSHVYNFYDTQEETKNA